MMIGDTTTTRLHHLQLNWSKLDADVHLTVAASSASPAAAVTTRVIAGELTGTGRAGGWTDTWHTSITGTVTEPPNTQTTHIAPCIIISHDHMLQLVTACAVNWLTHPSKLTNMRNNQSINLSVLFICFIHCSIELSFLPGAQPRLKSWGWSRFWSQHRDACAPRPGLGVGCGRWSPLPLWWFGVSPSENFWKLRC